MSPCCKEEIKKTTYFKDIAEAHKFDKVRCTCGLEWGYDELLEMRFDKKGRCYVGRRYEQSIRNSRKETS